MPKVFVSAGTVTTPRQKAAVETVVNCLETNDLSARRMGVNEWSYKEPLKAIRKAIGECDGIVAIVFERYLFPSGSERKSDGDTALGATSLPTVWNHIEAAIGYANDLPLLVIVERGLWVQGFLEDRYDWGVYLSTFEPEDFRSERFTQMIRLWKADVHAHAEARTRVVVPAEVDVSKISVGKLFQQLSLPQVWAVLSALCGLLIAVAGISYKVGGGKWPWQ